MNQLEEAEKMNEIYLDQNNDLKEYNTELVDWIEQKTEINKNLKLQLIEKAKELRDQQERI